MNRFVGLMPSERKRKRTFTISGPSHLTDIDWGNPDYRRSVMASLVQGVYVLENDQKHKRSWPDALAPPWWEHFHFRLHAELHDPRDNSIYGAIFAHECPNNLSNYSHPIPMPIYVIAFRGTVWKGRTIWEDAKLDLSYVVGKLQNRSRVDDAMETTQRMMSQVGEVDAHAIWLAGHSLGSAIALQVGRELVIKMGVCLNTFLFNLPMVFLPEAILSENKLVKHAFHDNSQFLQLLKWTPQIFVNESDFIRNWMDKIGLGKIERVATKNWIPTAYLTVNLVHAESSRQAHAIEQWWAPNFKGKTELHEPSDGNDDNDATTSG